MHPITQGLGGAAVFASVFAIGFSASQLAEELRASTVPASSPEPAPALTIDIGARCAEDDPCWSWSTMGDRQRGVLVDGKLRVVNACTFRKLVIAGRVDRKADPMRGDAWALANGCGAGAQLALHPSGVTEG